MEIQEVKKLSSYANRRDDQ